jgi:hypothetical protein
MGPNEGYNAGEDEAYHFAYDQTSNSELYSPYSSDETLSSKFFRISSDSISSQATNVSEMEPSGADPYVCFMELFFIF